MRTHIPAKLHFGPFASTSCSTVELGVGCDLLRVSSLPGFSLLFHSQPTRQRMHVPSCTQVHLRRSILVHSFQISRVSASNWVLDCVLYATDLFLAGICSRAHWHLPSTRRPPACTHLCKDTSSLTSCIHLHHRGGQNFFRYPFKFVHLRTMVVSLSQVLYHSWVPVSCPDSFRLVSCIAEHANL
ncbi:hypothetical protein FPV67DRAFT_1506433 [Lyophyllum atratum]|nr:hypothetical protein FPV67DRAFT_1506433 [Lyophyllum atratum]